MRRRPRARAPGPSRRIASSSPSSPFGGRYAARRRVVLALLPLERASLAGEPRVDRRPASPGSRRSRAGTRLRRPRPSTLAQLGAGERKLVQTRGSVHAVAARGRRAGNDEALLPEVAQHPGRPARLTSRCSTDGSSIAQPYHSLSGFARAFAAVASSSRTTSSSCGRRDLEDPRVLDRCHAVNRPGREVVGLPGAITIWSRNGSPCRPTSSFARPSSTYHASSLTLWNWS
jgi:hypothetical protein